MSIAARRLSRASQSTAVPSGGDVIVGTGALPIGSASYAMPSDGTARYVSPTGANGNAVRHRLHHGKHLNMQQLTRRLAEQSYCGLVCIMRVKYLQERPTMPRVGTSPFLSIIAISPFRITLEKRSGSTARRSMPAGQLTAAIGHGHGRQCVAT